MGGIVQHFKNFLTLLKIGEIDNEPTWNGQAWPVAPGMLGIYVGTEAPELKTYAEWLSSRTGYWSWIDISAEAAGAVTATIKPALAAGSINKLSASYTRYITATINPTNAVGSIAKLVATVTEAGYASGVVNPALAAGMISKLTAAYTRYITAAVQDANATGSINALVATVTSSGVAVSDSFSGDLSNWSQSGLSIVAGHLSGTGVGYWTTDLFNDNQYAEAHRLGGGSTNSYHGPCVRMNASRNTYYVLVPGIWNDGEEDYESLVFAKIVSGTSTGLWSLDGNTDTFVRLEVSGTTITIKSKANVGDAWTTRHTMTDSSIASGGAGIQNNSSSNYDDWAGGDL